MNKNSIKLKYNLITNFKPRKILYFDNFSTLKNKRIYCRNFLIYMLLINYLNKNNSNYLKNKIFIKKSKNKVYTILKSPYRHKLARHQISINRFLLYSILKINVNLLKFSKFTDILKTLIIFKKFNKIYETNLIYINSLTISFKLSFNKNFILENFVL